MVVPRMLVAGSQASGMTADGCPVAAACSLA